MQDVINFIQKYSSFTIAFHINPDGDALGASLALKMLLEKFGKKVCCVTASKIPSHYQFLPSITSIHYNEEIPDTEVIIFIECSDFARSGYKGVDANRVLINIDHHVTNDLYADVNCVEPNLSSTSEQIYNLYKMFNEDISYKAAICLYVGILTDTDRFQNSNTHPEVYSIVRELVEKGINVNEVYRKVYGSKRLPYVQFLGYVLSEVELIYENKVAYGVVSQHLMKKYQIESHEMEGIIEHIRDIEGVDVAILFKETKDFGTKISFRSTERVEVDALAQEYGGGGHKRASGCFVQQKLSDVKALILASMEKYLHM